MCLQKNLILTVWCIVVCVVSGTAQSITNKGLEFWVGYGHHQYMEPACGGGGTVTNDMNMVIYLSAEEAATVTVTIDSSGPFPGAWFSRTYNIPANTVISTENLPKGTINSAESGSVGNFDARLITDPPPSGTGGEGLFRKKGIHIQSNVPIVAYAHIYGGVASGATMLMPVAAWGYSYTSMNSEQTDAARSYSWMYVIAKDDNTRIEITPSARTRMGKNANVPFQIQLNKGQIYQLIGQADCTTGDGVELTGTTVRSIAGSDGECHPIATFSGSSRTGGESLFCGVSEGRDNDMQQLFPEQTWGKRYLTAPFSVAVTGVPRPGQYQTSIYKVLVKDPSTVVKRNNVTLTGLIAGKFYKFASNATDSIIADKPVMVAQFMGGSATCKGSADGDPEMVYLSPLEQAIKKVGFYRNNRQNIQVNYLTLIVPTPGVSSLRIDGSSVFTHSYPHARPGYTVVIQSWAAEQAQCFVSCDSAFTAITYGLGITESYAYNAGTYLNNLNGISDLTNIADTTNGGKNSHLFTCVATPAKLSILMRYQPSKLVWELSKLGANITPNADITLDPASSAFTETVNVKGVVYYKYTLPGTYQFNTIGSFDVPVASTSPSLTENCKNTEQLYINFESKAAPVTDFTFSNATNCVRDITQFTAPDALGTDPAQQWIWTFPDGVISHKKDTGVIFLRPGDNPVKLQMVSKDGCIASASKVVSVLPPPTADITYDPGDICGEGSLLFTATTAFGGTAPIKKYHWNMGNGAIVDGVDIGKQSGVYTAPGKYEVKFVAGVSDLCISDTVRKIITIYSKPEVSIAYSAGCLPADGIVIFINNTSTTDGQLLTSHSWNFGDAASTPANPNVSAIAAPSHFFATGEYDINYKVTTSHGCITDTIIKASFSVPPRVDYPALNQVCEGVSPFSIATATVNGVIGVGGVYSGKGVSANGEFDPAVAGAGIHIIQYTSGGSCPVSRQTSIKVIARPLASFSTGSDVCLNGNLTITPEAVGGVVSWDWSFGDGRTQTYTTADPFINKYSSTGYYTISLRTRNNQGCYSLPLPKAINVHPLPIADFEVPVKICLPGDAIFTNNTSSVSDNSNLIYSWNFGDNSVSSPEKNPSHVYAQSGNYRVTLTAMSAYGCSTTSTSKLVNDFYQRPFAAFTVLPAEICQGSEVVFTDASTPLGMITGWTWNFGDGSASVTGVSPSKVFTAPGSFNVSLVATNTVGCESKPASNKVIVHLQPSIDAGMPIVTAQGTMVELKATANSPGLVFNWTGPGMISDHTVLRPLVRADQDGTYKLTATGEYNCTATDDVSVRIQRNINIPNAFSPNGDNVNDRWVIPHLIDYFDCTVEVFNRYGQRIYYSIGYTTPWGGDINGKQVPIGVYYYIIQLNNGIQPITGSVTVLR